MAKGNQIAASDDWQTQDDVRVLCKAEEIKKDPKRLKAALKYAQDQIEVLEDLIQKLMPRKTPKLAKKTINHRSENEYRSY